MIFWLFFLAEEWKKVTALKYEIKSHVRLGYCSTFHVILSIFQ